MQRVLLLATLWSAGVLSGAPVSIPTVAYPFTTNTLQRSDVVACVERLTLLSKGHRSDYERAAFLVLKDDGSFECRVWPGAPAWRRASWYGSIPMGTVAIVHTHPADMPRPSEHDFAEARRVMAPVIVVSRQGVMVAQPFGENSARPSRVYTFAPDETAANSLP